MLTRQTRLIARDKREWTRDSVKRDLRVSLNNRGFSAFSLIARLCSAWSILNFAWANLIFAALSPWNWLVWNANINHKGLQRTANEYTEERRMLVWNAWTWIATCSVCIFLADYDFLICFDARTVGLDWRIRGKASAVIGRNWKTSRQIYKHILASEEFF